MSVIHFRANSTNTTIWLFYFIFPCTNALWFTLLKFLAIAYENYELMKDYEWNLLTLKLIGSYLIYLSPSNPLNPFVLWNWISKTYSVAEFCDMNLKQIKTNHLFWWICLQGVAKYKRVFVEMLVLVVFVLSLYYCGEFNEKGVDIYPL